MKKSISIILALTLVLSSFVPAFAGTGYEVKKGDVLWKIAQKYGLTYQELAENNNISNPNLIYPGEILKISDAKTAIPATTAAPSSKDSASTNGDTTKEKTDVKAVAPNGTYIGQDNNGIAEFLGIRYAAPVERWKAPKDVTTTSKDIITAQQWGASCIQPYDDVEIASQWKQSEDCLTLNVWTKNVNTKGKPVMIFIHGGSYTVGGTYDPLYDGENFVRNLAESDDAVMVTINYRLGMFGSLDLSSLAGYTDDYYDAINLWLLDEIQALKWVNRNIEAFGGDTGNVTVFGQSSGSMSTAFLMAKPEARHYFQKAIMESGVPFYGITTKEIKEENSKKVFDILGVKSINELMAISDEEISKKYIDKINSEVSLSPRVADGVIIPASYWEDFKNGCAKDLSLMIGQTNGEMDTSAYDWPNYPATVKDPDAVWKKILSHLAEQGDAPTSMSPVNHPDAVKKYMALGDDKVQRMADLNNNVAGIQGSIYYAEAQSKWNKNIYLYSWTWAPDREAVMKAEGDAAETSPYGRALHCMELPFVLGTIEKGYRELTGPPELAPENLMKQTQATWYAFAKTGDPSNDLIPSWEPYNTKTRMTMVIGKEWKPLSDPWADDRIILNEIRPLGEKN